MGPMASSSPEASAGVIGARLDGLSTRAARELLEGRCQSRHSGDRVRAGTNGAGSEIGPRTSRLRWRRWARPACSSYTTVAGRFVRGLVRDIAYSRLTKTERGPPPTRALRRRHRGPRPARSQTRSPITIEPRPRLDRELGGVHNLPSDLADRAVEWTLRAAGAMSGERAGERGCAVCTPRCSISSMTTNLPPAWLRFSWSGSRRGRPSSGWARPGAISRWPLPWSRGRPTDNRLDIAMALVESELPSGTATSRERCGAPRTRSSSYTRAR